jgi:hypothetical protein
MRICLLLVAALAGCSEADKPRHDAPPTATGPTAREQTARDARRQARHGTPLLSIPRVASVRWRYDTDERYVTILEVPSGGATGTVWMTVHGRRERVGWVHPGHRAEAAALRQGAVDIKVVQVTEPATVRASVRVVYERGHNQSAVAPLVTSRVETNDHSR